MIVDELKELLELSGRRKPKVAYFCIALVRSNNQTYINMNKMKNEIFRGFFEGAIFQQPQIVIAQNGSKVVYQEVLADKNEKPQVADCQMVAAIEKIQSYFWAQSAWAVVFCVCRDILGMTENMTEFERYVKKLPFTRTLAYECPEGTIQKALLNNQYMRLSVDKWRNNGAKERAMILAEKLITELEEK